LLLSLIVLGCATAPPPPAPSVEASTQNGVIDGEWTDAHIRQDLERSVQERYGEAAFQRAAKAEAWIMSKLYRGMPLPPTRQPDGSWKEAPHPVALMVRENGQWKRANDSGFADATAAEQAEIEALLNSGAFWAEPARIPQGGCTDGGSTLFLIRLPGRPPQVRQGTCGGPPLHARLLSAVF
jgi:hypothetical protein